MKREHKIKTMMGLHTEYIEYSNIVDGVCYDWGRLLPEMGIKMRPVVPGEVVFELGETGSGKTAMLQAIAKSAGIQPPKYPLALETLFCELELPGTLCYERFAAMQTGISCADIMADYQQSYTRDDNERLAPYYTGLEHIKVCDSSRMSDGDLEELIDKHETYFGIRPVIVIVDYVGLMECEGAKRYERITRSVQELKRTARSTNTIIFCSSQVHRTGEDAAEHIGLHAAKDSSAIEDSGGVVFSINRDQANPHYMRIEILKSTKDGGGYGFDCNFGGANMQITPLSAPEPQGRDYADDLE